MVTAVVASLLVLRTATLLLLLSSTCTSASNRIIESPYTDNLDNNAYNVVNNANFSDARTFFIHLL